MNTGLPLISRPLIGITKGTIDIFVKKGSAKAKEDLLISDFEKFAESKRLCVGCYQPIKESKIRGVNRTRKQTYNYLKARSLDGKVRCRECMIRWLKNKIEEIT